jgi:hypothetical protein
MEVPNRQYFLETEVFNFNGGGSTSVYHGGTYTGYLKVKGGGIKIVFGKEDDRICKERELILDYLNDILSKKEQLNPEEIPTSLFYKALEGKYIRNLMCIEDHDKCDAEIDSTLKKAYKLSKNIIKHLNEDSFEEFKQYAPQLYKHLKEAREELEYYFKLKQLKDKYLSGSTGGKRELSETGGNMHRDSAATRKEEIKNLVERGGYKLNENDYDHSLGTEYIRELEQSRQQAREDELADLKRNRLVSSKSDSERSMRGGNYLLEQLRMELNR